MKSISFNEQYGDWNARIRALVLGMLALFMIIVYSATFIIADSDWLAVGDAQNDEISQAGVLGVSDKQVNVTLGLKNIAEDVATFSINVKDMKSPLFAEFVFYSPDVELFDAYCIDIPRCTADLEGDYLYIDFQGVTLPLYSSLKFVNVEFNPEDSGFLTLDNSLASDSYLMEQGSEVNLIENSYFSFHLGSN